LSLAKKSAVVANTLANTYMDSASTTKQSHCKGHFQLLLFPFYIAEVRKYNYNTSRAFAADADPDGYT